MPLYEYRCQQCDHLAEFLQKMNDPAPATCPACGREHTMHKEVSLTSFQLKGGGWYKDLYGSVPKDSGKDAGQGASDAKSSDAKSSDGAKSATKTEGKSSNKGDGGSTKGGANSDGNKSTTTSTSSKAA